MDKLPHHYSVSGVLNGDKVVLSSGRLSPLESGPPAEFGGSGDYWSPETLLVAAVSDCFLLSFKAIAGASKYEWDAVGCEVSGKLDTVDKKMMFTEFEIVATLNISDESQEDRGRRLLEKSEQACLISNSLSAKVVFRPEVIVAA